jgi:hypothetical protein
MIKNYILNLFSKSISYKNIFASLLLFGVFFLCCKKDPLVNSSPLTEESPSPFVLKNDIYPNPCQGIFTIKPNTIDSQNVKLFSMSGTEIFSLTINGTTSIVDKNLVNGIYFLTISSKHGTNSNKIIVSK